MGLYQVTLLPVRAASPHDFSGPFDFVQAMTENGNNGKYVNRPAQKTSVRSVMLEIGRFQSSLAQQSILILTTTFLA